MQVGINDGDSHLCSFAGCSEIDLLPARCSNCHRTFCSQHIGSSAHHCPATKNVMVAACPICMKVVSLEYAGQPVDEAVSRHIERGCRDVPQSTARLSPGGGRRLMDEIPCVFPGCKETSVVRCDLCEKRFCVTHRDPGRHSCKNRRTPPPETMTATETAKAAARPAVEGPVTVADLLLRPSNTRRTAVGKAAEAKVDMVVPLISFVIPKPGSAEVVYGIAPFFMHVIKNYALGKVLDLAVDEGGQRHAVVRNMKKPWRMFIVLQPTPPGATAAMYAPVSLTTLVKNSALGQVRSGASSDDAIIFITPLEVLPPEALTASRAVRLKSKEDSDSCNTM